MCHESIMNLTHTPQMVVLVKTMIMVGSLTGNLFHGQGIIL